MTLRVTGRSQNDSVEVTVDAIKGVGLPIRTTIARDANISQSLVALLDGAVKSFTRRSCDQCVENFIDYYSKCIGHNCDSNLFVHYPTRKEIKQNIDTSSYSFVIDNKTSAERSFAIFPENASAGGTYFVRQGEQSIAHGGTLYLPDNFTLKIDPAIRELQWTFDRILFGKGATIDLSHHELEKPKPATPVPKFRSWYRRSCPSGSTSVIETVNGISGVGSNGENGDSGIAGEDGISGTTLHLVSFYLPSKGNLWIRIDGSRGQDGGDGGNGGAGAWGHCESCTHGIDGGDGGNGGVGGTGGSGGNTASAFIELLDLEYNPIRVYTPSSVQSCSASQRPAELSDDDGQIILYGTPGCNGKGGIGGVGGERGHGCNCGRLCPAQSHDGRNGVSYNAISAQDGKAGNIGNISILINHR
ncbi:hypothetical protein [Chitinophaga silvisoli]|uniref:hypothetical protein n=1 Tax=Chitinophaga silvisoli TaxID=2291814 RepID=UPI0011C116A2|nr:hypothetical protein [Chitinophaga silvisoli]